MEIQSLHQWYVMLDEQSKIVQKYEDTIDKFYKILKYNQRDIYTKPLMTKFYESDSYSKHISKIIISLILPMLAIMGLTTIISWIYSIINTHINLIKACKQFGVEYLIKSAIIGLIVMIVVYILVISINYISFKSITSKLSKYENDLYDIIKTIPNRYRTSERMELLAQIYFTRNDVDVNIAFEVCDEFMYKNAKRPFLPVMYDVNYENKLLSGAPISNNNNDSINNNSTTNESNIYYLPADIISKTFAGSNNSETDLNSMIGLDSVKSQIEKLKNRISYYGNANNNGNHMIFLGSAGTGKTTVARIITKILYDLKIITKNQYVEISGDYLRSGDSNRVSAIMDYAIGGVLFIDEAYLLYDKHGQGDEATGILLKAMEDRRSDFVCILAGYEEQMTKLLSSNEGFTSRIKHTIYFPDYTVDEMYNIFNSFIHNYNSSSYTLNENAKSLLLETFELEKQSKSFGNARTVRNAVDTIMDYYVDRSINSNQDSHIIELEDIEKYSNDRKTILQHELKNMSASNQLDESIIRLSELKSKLKNGSYNPEYDLQQLIGLESFSKEIDLLKSQKEFYNNTEHQKILLLGNDGCGKSSITKILTGYLYNLGYIRENKYLDISAEFLKGSYVGHTNKRAEAIISYASGGVLLIKNINMLINSDDSFSQEAISAIMTALNENTNVTIVISDNESDYLNSIKNMFTLTYAFPIYTTEQLHKIFLLQAKNDNFAVSQETSNKILNYVSNSKIDIRDIISLYNIAKKNHISNFDGNEANKFILLPEDIMLTNNIDNTNTTSEIPKLKIKIKI